MVEKRKIHKLAIEIENDYSLIGIASHENDYRLSWAINRALGLDLKKKEDLTLNHPRHKIIINYSLYSYDDENNYQTFNLISNKSEKGFLLHDLKNIDFVFRVSGHPDQNLLNELLLKLKKIDIVITAFLINDVSEKLRRVFIF